METEATYLSTLSLSEIEAYISDYIESVKLTDSELSAALKLKGDGNTLEYKLNPKKIDTHIKGCQKRFKHYSDRLTEYAKERQQRKEAGGGFAI